MKPVKINGFTIVETMLFLGISGLLIMGILVGTGTSINTQRYRDSVTSLQSFLQQQYSEVSNVSNDSQLNSCYGDDTNNNPWGQSNCVILGRYITTTDGKNLNINGVIGYIPPNTAPSATDDVSALQDYHIRSVSANSSTYEVEWGALISKSGGAIPMPFSILILRSPTSGAILTFINNTSTTNASNISNLLATPPYPPTALGQSAKLCIDSNGLFTGPKMAVFVKNNSSSGSGIETLGENNRC